MLGQQHADEVGGQVLIRKASQVTVPFYLKEK